MQGTIQDIDAQRGRWVLNRHRQKLTTEAGDDLACSGLAPSTPRGTLADVPLGIYYARIDLTMYTISGGASRWSNAQPSGAGGGPSSAIVGAGSDG